MQMLDAAQVPVTRAKLNKCLTLVQTLVQALAVNYSDKDIFFHAPEGFLYAGQRGGQVKADMGWSFELHAALPADTDIPPGMEHFLQ